MNIDEIFSIILKLVSAVAVMLVAYVLPVVSKKIKATIGDENADKLESVIRTFVISAEATMRMSTGAEKKAFVEQQLEDLGYEVTDYVKAKIEEVVADHINFGIKDHGTVDNTPAVEEQAAAEPVSEEVQSTSDPN